MIARPAPRIFVSAGEPSGDLHGAGVVQALRARHPDATIEALGGPRMAAAGAKIRYPMEGLAAFGLVEVVTKLRAHTECELGDMSREILHGSQLFMGGSAEPPGSDPALRDELLRYAADLPEEPGEPRPEGEP